MTTWLQLQESDEATDKLPNWTIIKSALKAWFDDIFADRKDEIWSTDNSR